MRAREFMSTPVVSVRREATLKEVVRQMAARRVSGVPVVDGTGRLVGMISESDLLVKLEYGEPGSGLLGLLDRLSRVMGAERKLEARTAGELMTSRVVSAGPEASFRELLHLMATHDINRVPIVEHDQVVGIVTRADLLRMMARPDMAITEDAQWRILHDLWIDTGGLRITTRDGVVTVSGEVGTRSEAELVKHWIAAMEGVLDVDAGGLRYRFDDRGADPPRGSLESPPRT